MDQRKAARVLPEPVGAMMRVLRPSRMLSHAPSCAAVGVLKVRRNHSRTGAEKGESASVMFQL